MSNWAQIILSLAIAGGLAHAGMRHPIEQTTPEALEVQSTRMSSTSGYSSSGRIMPDRALSVPAAPVPSTLPQQAKGQPALPSAPQDMPSSAKAPLPVAPVPKAPGLPAASNLSVPQVHLPASPGRDGLLSIKPDKLSLRGGVNRAQIHSFLRSARGLKLPSREYAKDLQAAGIAQRYHAALHPTPYRPFRTAYKLSIDGIGKISDPPSAVHYENMVRRIDSLFRGLELSYPRAIQGLWELSELNTNPRPLQARDALFAGILSERAGWETPASNLIMASLAKGIDREDRYLRILWSELDRFEANAHVDAAIQQVNPSRANSLPLEGDKAHFAMAKRMLLERPKAPAALNPGAEGFLAQIRSHALRDRFQLLSLVGRIRSGHEQAREKAVSDLKALEAEGDQSVRQEARLALARSSLMKGSGPGALPLYRNITKNGRNRLEVLAEQTFAEFLSGEHQESLGKAVALQSPYFAYGFVPDIHLVEILSRKAMCDFGGAEAGARRFAERYGKELAAIESVLTRKVSAADYYEELVSYHELEQPLRFQRYMLQLPAVMENQKTMNRALVDLQKIDSLGRKREIIERPAGWDQFTSAMAQSWAGRARELRKGSSEAALREAEYMAKRLRNTFAQIELLDLDISTGAAKNYNVQSALNFPARKPAELEAEQDKFRWPYEEEIWEDEIDFMRAKNPSKCALAAAH
jgi:hypothetical protein